jgi:hypothetical protein
MIFCIIIMCLGLIGNIMVRKPFLIIIIWPFAKNLLNPSIQPFIILILIRFIKILFYY